MTTICVACEEVSGMHLRYIIIWLLCVRINKATSWSSSK